MIISRTPFRISFFGGGTDYPAWFREYGGAVVGTTIDKYCYLTVRRLPPFFEHKARIVYSNIELVHDYAEVKHPAVRGVLTDKALPKVSKFTTTRICRRAPVLGRAVRSRRSAQCAAGARRPHGEQARARHGGDSDRTGGSEGKRRLPGSALGGVRRAQSHRVFSRRRIFRIADHTAAGTAR